MRVTAVALGKHAANLPWMSHSTTFHQRVHGRVMALLTGGCIAWRQPCAMPGEGHRNLLSGRPYLGADSILLDLALVSRGATLRWWCTYAEARQAGLSPRRGAEGVHLGLAEGKGRGGQRVEVVFHVSDLVGPKLQGLLTRRQHLVRANRPAAHARLRMAEHHLRAWPVAVQRGHHLPGYRRRDDLILLPCPQAFHCREIFLATWAQLQIQSTGHPARLGRGAEVDMAGEAEPFIGELAWILLADRLCLSRQHGLFALAATDWIQCLGDRPEAFFQLLVQAGRAAELLQSEHGDERMC